MLFRDKEIWKKCLRTPQCLIADADVALFKDTNSFFYTSNKQYISLLFGGKSYLIDVIGQDTEYTVFMRNSFRTIKVFNDEMLLHESLKKGGGFGADQDLKSGMPGKIIEIFAKEGDSVESGAVLIKFEEP